MISRQGALRPSDSRRLSEGQACQCAKPIKQMAAGTGAPVFARAPGVLACCACTCRTLSTALGCRGSDHPTDPTKQRADFFEQSVTICPVPGW